MEQYKALYREAKPIPSEDHHMLTCFYYTNKNNPRLILRPAKVEVAFPNPKIYIFRDIISEPEMARLKELAEPKSPPKPSPAFQLEPSAGAPRVPPNGTPAPEGGASLQQGGGRKNFLAANIEGAGRHHVRRPPSREKVEQTQARRERAMAQYQRGKVPQYLRQRQDQWRQEEEQRKAMEPDPSVPPGHTLMPAEERRRTLQLLSERQAALTIMTLIVFIELLWLQLLGIWFLQRAKRLTTPLPLQP